MHKKIQGKSTFHETNILRINWLHRNPEDQNWHLNKNPHTIFLKPKKKYDISYRLCFKLVLKYMYTSIKINH